MTPGDASTHIRAALTAKGVDVDARIKAAEDAAAKANAPVQAGAGDKGAGKPGDASGDGESMKKLLDDILEKQKKDSERFEKFIATQMAKDKPGKTAPSSSKRKAAPTDTEDEDDEDDEVFSVPDDTADDEDDATPAAAATAAGGKPSRASLAAQVAEKVQVSRDLTVGRPLARPSRIWSARIRFIIRYK